MSESKQSQLFAPREAPKAPPAVAPEAVAAPAAVDEAAPAGPKRLFLVDGSNQAFRAFFAIQTDMRSPDGFPTRALYGFTNMLRKMLRDYRPDYAAVVFDVGVSFRNELYPDYKGQRPDMPEDLRAQWPEFQPLCEEWGVRALAEQGWEADDIIGTLCTQLAGPELEVFIASSDKDFAQLVNEHVVLLDLQRDATYDVAGVEEKWGLPPERIIDLLALMGDTSDNVPGVPGIGAKTGAGFLQKHGGLDQLLADAIAGKVKGKRGAAIAEHLETVALARKLVTIHTNWPHSMVLEDLAPREPDWVALQDRFQRYHFRRLLEEAQQNVAGEGGAPVEEAESQVAQDDYRVVDTAEGLAQLVADLRAAGRFAFDTETTSLDSLEAELVGMSFCWDPAFAVYLPIAHEGEGNCPGALEAMAPLLMDAGLKKTGQNLKYDLKVLRSRGYDLCGIDGDTMVADYVLNVDQRHNLDDLASRLLEHKMISYKETTAEVDGQFARVPVAEAARYAAEDAHVVWLIEQAQVFEGELERVYREVDLPLVPVLADMELEGIGVDVEALASLSTELGERVAALELQAYEEAGEEFNLNSPKQLAVILFEKRGLTPIKKTKTGPSTDAATLETLAAQGDALCTLILDYRQLHKLKSTYVDALPSTVAADGRIHTHFHQAVAATGRLSSNDPNLQNIPIRTAEGRRIRECFVAREGMRFLSADYSQIELRVLAHFCGEGGLVEAFRAGQDIHRRTASEIFEVPLEQVTADQRRAAKAINFGLVYGMSAFRLANDLGIGRSEAAAYIDSYFERYPQVKGYMDQAIQDAKDKGYAETLFGRRRPVFGLDSRRPQERGAAERIAINTPVQGSAADLIKVAMVRVHRRLAAELPQARLLLQVHDELVLEVPVAMLEAARSLVVEEMEGAFDLLVPLVVDTGEGGNWNDAH